MKEEGNNNPAKANVEAVLFYDKFLGCGQTDDEKRGKIKTTFSYAKD